MKTNLLLLLLLSLVLFSCEEEIIEKEFHKDPAWRAHERFDGINKIKINSHVANNELYMYGPNFYSVIDSDYGVTNYFFYGIYPEFLTLPISSKYFVSVFGQWGNSVFFNPTQPETNQHSNGVNLENLSPNFSFIDFGYSYKISAISINEVGQCLVSTHTKNYDIAPYIFSVATDENGYIQVTDTTAFFFPNLDYDSYTYLSKGYKDYFLFGTSKGLFKLHSNGRNKQVLNKSVNQVFRHKDVLYATKELEGIYISTNEGETWAEWTGFSRDLALSNYFTIGDSLVAVLPWGGDIICTFNFNTSTGEYKCRPLDVTGLDDVGITSVAILQDSVYLTSYSGVFVKHKDHFFMDQKLK